MRSLRIFFIILLLVTAASVLIANYRARTKPLPSNTGGQKSGQQTNSPEVKDAKAFYDEGVNQYSTPIPYDPVNYEQKLRQKFEAAAESFKRAISLKPDFPEAYQYLGSSYAALQQYDLAIEAYEQATRLKPNWWEPYNGIGQAYMSLRRYQDAIVAYQEALNVYKKTFGEPHAGMTESLAIAYLKSGDRNAATKQYEVLKKICEKRDCGKMVNELGYLLNEK